MLEILHFVFSNFWVWIGFTITLTIILYSIAVIINQLLKIRESSVAVIRKEVMKISFKEIQNDPMISSYHKILMAEILIRMSKKCKKLSDSEIQSLIGKMFDVK